MTLTAALQTPALLVDRAAVQHNIATMSAALPGRRLRPHVKAFKSTALAHRLADAGHRAFTCATIREVEGMARAGLGDDLLLANEVLDTRRLGAVATETGARITVAVDSPETVAAAAAGGVAEVLIDVDVGLPRCGCPPQEAGRLAESARAAGLHVRGIMGYEGHAMAVADDARRRALVEESVRALAVAHEQVGGDVVSAGGTGTYALNTAATEIQAGSYLLMDTAYATLGLPFRQALSLLCTVVSVSRRGHVVLDGGLKALAMDHGNPTAERGEVWFCSDEHTTVRAVDAVVGERLQLWPAHVDPTVAKHEIMHVVDGEEVVETWPVDLRGW